MSITFEGRTSDVRALATSVAVGTVLGLSVGGAYMAGVFARSSLNAPGSANVPVASTDSTPVSHVAGPAPAKVASAAPEAPVPLQASIGAVPDISMRDRLSLPLVPLTAGLAAGAGGQKDVQCLAQAVYYEARGESPTGQAAVAQVVLNRVRAPSFPKSVCGVVFQRQGDDCQFSFACNGAMRQAVDQRAWRRAEQVAHRAIAGQMLADIGGATMFHTASAERAFTGGLMKAVQIGAHVFYQLTRHGGGPVFHAEPERPAGEPVHAVFASFTPLAVAAIAPAERSAPVETKSAVAEPKAVEAKTAEAKPLESKPLESKAGESKAFEPKAPEPKPAPAESKSAPEQTAATGKAPTSPESPLAIARAS